MAALSAMDDAEMALPYFLQPQGDPGHCAHEGRVHHAAILQVDHELAVTPGNHFLGELFQIAAVQEASPSFNPDPNSRSINPY